MKKWMAVFVLLAAATLSAQTSVPGWPSTGGGSGSGSSGISPTQPAFLVTASPYNAKCDGSTDDTTAIQAAITAAQASTPTGATVVFPAGQCNISSALTVSGAAITLTGQGKSGGAAGGAVGTMIASTSSSADIIDITGSPDVVIQNLAVGRTVAATGSSKGISIAAAVAQTRISHVYAWDSIFDIYLAGTVANILMEDVWALANKGGVTDGFHFDGQMNSSICHDCTVIPTGGRSMTNGFNFANGSVSDMFLYHPEVTGGVTTGININGVTALDIHIINPILDNCSGNCINITNSTSASGANNIHIVDCWCNSGNVVASPILISGSDGVQLIGGIVQAHNTSAAVGVIQTAGTNTRLNIVGVKVINVSPGSTGNNVAINLGGVSDSNITGNNVFASSANTLSAGIALSSTSTNNTISGNSISGNGTSAITVDATSTGNTFSSNTIDMTHWTSAIVDSAGTNTYSSSTLASGITGSATSIKATAGITGAIPVKLDTSNANQVVTTTTTDTGGGVVVGVCPNTPTAGNSCLVMTGGLVPLTLGTGTCAIGNFVIVDTTTNGRVKCTATYSAGTVIGTAQAANSTVGTTFNVALGLR